jgi:dihydroxyacetone kinase-like predicted kinase
MAELLEFKFDTQMLIAGENLDEDEINDYITDHFEGDCLLVVGDDTLIKIHFHTNRPWEVLEYASTLGDLHDIVVENMQRQAEGLKG